MKLFQRVLYYALGFGHFKWFRSWVGGRWIYRVFPATPHDSVGDKYRWEHHPGPTFKGIQVDVEEYEFPKATARPRKYLQAQRKDLHEDSQIFSFDPSGLSTGRRLAGHEGQDINLEALLKTCKQLDEIADRYGQPRRRPGHVPFLVTHVPAVFAGEVARKSGLPGEGTQGEHPPMQVSCEMIRVTEDQDISCGKDAAGITTDGVRVCFSCGQQMRSEGFLVVPLRPRARELLFPFANIGDRFRFTYPEEPQFNVELTVTEVKGFQPNDLVFFDDGTHCKQHVIGTLERI